MSIIHSKKRFLALTAIALVSASSAATFNLPVSFADSIRPVTHCASGSLYGITETLPTDITNMVAPLKPHVFVQPALSGAGRQQPIGAAMPVSARLVNTTGKVQIRLADVLPGWPYRWPGKTSWINSVTEVIHSKKASGRNNYDGYEIWNEPDGTWQAASGNFYTEAWKPAYDLIKSLDPGARIIGPSYSYYSSSRMTEFLTYCKNNNCLPDVISWHQWGSGGFIGALENYRALERSLGISPRALSINEYSSTTHEYEGSPGVSVPFIAKFERNNVESASISWWFTNLPGRLGSLLTANNAKGGGWWLYKWYGDMTGHMVKVTPPNDKSEGVDGFASLDKNQKYASIIIGGNSIGTINVNITGLPSFFGSKVNIKIEYVTWVNKDTAVPSTTQISNQEYTLTNGAISVPVEITNQFYAYRLYITPAQPVVVVPQSPYGGTAWAIPGTIQAENYDLGGEDSAYHDADATNSGNVYRNDGVDITGDSISGYKIGWTMTDEWLEYTVNVSSAKVYHWTARVSMGGDSAAFRMSVDGNAITDRVQVPGTGSWDTYTEINGVTTSVLPLGKHVLRLSIDRPYVNIDWIRFEEQPVSLFKYKESTASQNTIKWTRYDLNGRAQSK